MTVTILIVNEAASDRALMKSALSEYRVLTASDCAKAMQMLKEQDEIGLLLLDLSTLKSDGLQLLKNIKEDESLKNLYTIILTSEDESDIEIKGLKLGAADYIRTPINGDALKARIDVHAALLRVEQALKQLGKETETLDMIFDGIPIGIAVSYSGGSDYNDETIIKVNSMYEQITGWTKQEILRRGWARITHPDDLEEEMLNYKKLQSGEIKSYSMDKRYIKPDGSIVWVHIMISSLPVLKDHQTINVCLIKDINEQKMIEKALSESERSKSIVLSHLPGLAYRCKYDSDWTMLYVSQGCYNLTGYPPESLLYNRDLSFNDIISPEYREELRNEWDRNIPTKQPFKHEYEIITASGEKKWVLEMGQAIYNENDEVEALEGIVLDISDRKAFENTLQYNSEHNQWTGLYNRDYLISLLKRDARLRKGSKKAMIGVNLSMVRLLSFNYGFQYAQNLIKKAAEALSQHCTDYRLLFHPHEYHFLFYVFDYQDKNELIEFGNLIAETLELLFQTERIGGGIGILEIDENQDESDVELLMRKILIAAERSVSIFERNFEIYYYDQEMQAAIDRERHIVAALNAIASGEHTGKQLFLQYQPIIDAVTGSICGFEALSRLKTDKLGLVSPAEFIPLAEKTKLIIPIGEQVIIKAFQFLNKLKEYGYENLEVAINVSVIQLLKPDFTSRLLELIDTMKINPKNVGIEITESVFAFDFENINNIIEKLREIGMNVAIDDFGTGYSSFAREKELNVDYLKIDKFFIDGLLITDPDKAITSDIISMSHKLGHRTIAEGVEHEKQMQYLIEHGCDKIQGYLISKPLDEEDAIAFLQRHGKALSLCR